MVAANSTVKGEARQQILTVAETLFAEHGVDAVSLRKINAAAGVSPGVLHYHFGSREIEADMSRAWTDYVAPRYGGFMDYYSMGFLYFDFFSGYSAPDWHDGRVTQSTDFMYFDKSIRKVVSALGKV